LPGQTTVVSFFGVVDFGAAEAGAENKSAPARSKPVISRKPVIFERMEYPPRSPFAAIRRCNQRRGMDGIIACSSWDGSLEA
jgi:hypothetical protein